MKGVQELRQELVSYLCQKGLDAVPAWRGERRQRPDRAVAAVSLRGMECKGSGLQDYLGERFDREKGQWEELYGRTVELTFGLDVYAAAAEEVQRGLDVLTAALDREGPGGMKVKELSVGETVYEEAAKIYTSKETMLTLIELLFQNGAAQVKAVSVTSAQETAALLENYKAAFGALEKAEDLAAVICDSDSTEVQKALQESVQTASEARRERLAVVFGGEEETATQLVQRAKTLNSERVVLIAPGGAEGAAAVAGAIAGENDPAVPLGGAVLKGLGSLDTDWSDNEIDTLVLGGVTPLEQVGGEISVVRGVTTRTKTGTANDATWRELTTIRIVDDVIPSLRNALRAKFSRVKNTEQGRGAIRSQVIVELENKVANEIITGYQDVTVEAMEDNPTVCLVEFKFTVAHGLNQIWLNAHITV